MTTPRDKIAKIINDTIFEDYGYGISDPYGVAGAIFAALPNMIAPLVWEFDEEDYCAISDELGFTYEICVDGGFKRTSNHIWNARAMLGGNVFSAIHLKILGSASFSDAKDACNKHKRDEFMKQLNPPTPTLD
jgi:hypothetical protein